MGVGDVSQIVHLFHSFVLFCVGFSKQSGCLETETERERERREDEAEDLTSLTLLCAWSQGRSQQSRQSPEIRACTRAQQQAHARQGLRPRGSSWEDWLGATEISMCRPRLADTAPHRCVDRHTIWTYPGQSSAVQTELRGSSSLDARAGCRRERVKRETAQESRPGESQSQNAP